MARVSEDTFISLLGAPPKTSRLVTNLDLRSLNVPTGTGRQTAGICRYGSARAITITKLELGQKPADSTPTTGVVTDAAFERGSLMWVCSKGDWWCCAVLPLGARATDRARRAHGLDRRPLSPRHSQRSLMRHCPGRHLEHEGWEGPAVEVAPFGTPRPSPGRSGVMRRRKAVHSRGRGRMHSLSATCGSRPIEGASDGAGTVGDRVAATWPRHGDVVLHAGERVLTSPFQSFGWTTSKLAK